MTHEEFRQRYEESMKDEGYEDFALLRGIAAVCILIVMLAGVIIALRFAVQMLLG